MSDCIYGPRCDKTCPGRGGVANNTGADQPARPHSLVNAFVICALEGSICLLNIGEI